MEWMCELCEELNAIVMINMQYVDEFSGRRLYTGLSLDYTRRFIKNNPFDFLLYQVRAQPSS